MNDIHILEVAKQAGINLQNDLHLIGILSFIRGERHFFLVVFIAEFIRTKDKIDQENLWVFRKNTASFIINKTHEKLIQFRTYIR